MTRKDSRQDDELRPITIETGVLKFPEGSALIRCGDTHVLCAASIDENVPEFLRGSGKGWTTAEYAMHPRATPRREQRDSRRGGVPGRSQEIQRLIGRALRAVVVLGKLGERTVALDCDVLQADGGTRTAAITGAWVALAIALGRAREKGLVKHPVLRDSVAATSVGLVGDRVLLDLAYTEDSAARVDMNVVQTGGGMLVEVQGTAEADPFPRRLLDQMLDAAATGIETLTRVQRSAVEAAGVDLSPLLEQRR
ncbi:MAG: ribonuclease PH [Deltaproteobacteria bacterium]|nr:ribonuclease PH [Deltaproteobacteria bacterium]